MYVLGSNRNQQAHVYAREGFIGKMVISAIMGNGQGGVSMREKQLERKLVAAVRAMGGIAPKFTSPDLDGMPDRLILLPMGKAAFVEVKRHGEKPRPLQMARHGMLRRLGFRVYVLDDAGQIGGILDEISTA
jgi:hypothetical protein